MAGKCKAHAKHTCKNHYKLLVRGSFSTKTGPAMAGPAGPPATALTVDRGIQLEDMQSFEQA